MGQTVERLLPPEGSAGTCWRAEVALRGKIESKDKIQAAALRLYGFKYDLSRALKGGKDVDEWRGKERVF